MLAAAAVALALNPGLGPATHAAMAQGYAHWGLDRGTHITVRFGDLPPRQVATAAAEGRRYTITFKRGLRWASQPELFCSVAVHEVGHIKQFVDTERMWHTNSGVMTAVKSVTPAPCR